MGPGEHAGSGLAPPGRGAGPGGAGSGARRPPPAAEARPGRAGRWAASCAPLPSPGARPAGPLPLAEGAERDPARRHPRGTPLGPAVAAAAGEGTSHPSFLLFPGGGDAPASLQWEHQRAEGERAASPRGPKPWMAEAKRTGHAGSRKGRELVWGFCQPEVSAVAGAWLCYTEPPGWGSRWWREERTCRASAPGEGKGERRGGPRSGTATPGFAGRVFSSTAPSRHGCNCNSLFHLAARPKPYRTESEATK